MVHKDGENNVLNCYTLNVYGSVWLVNLPPHHLVSPVDAVADCFVRCTNKYDFTEEVNTFCEKRKPDF